MHLESGIFAESLVGGLGGKHWCYLHDVVGIFDASLVGGLGSDHWCSLHDVALTHYPQLLQWDQHMMNHLYWVVR